MYELTNDWAFLLNEEMQKPYFLKLKEFLKKEMETYTIYPEEKNIFAALNYTSYKDVKVVILGQDPYHEPNQAHGLCFSVEKQIALPPSLKNIFKELQNEIDFIIPSHGNLSSWAKQGVLLLNTVLTVRKGMANSHKNKGWEIFTGRIIELLNERNDPIIFLLWGNDAKKKQSLITNKIHKILLSAHPSPLSAYHGFFNNQHFIETNKLLKSLGKEPINWNLD